MMLPRQRYPLGRGYAVEFRFDGRQIDVDWFPGLPPVKIGRRLFPAYQAARDQFLAKLAPVYGNIIVVDLREGGCE